MTLLLNFFSPSGRFKRLTFWEGLVAWLLLNIALMMIEVVVISYPLDDKLAIYLGDTDHVVYHFLTSAMLFVHWVFALWILVAICAKRWHDLNYPGWLAVVNIAPLVCLGLGVLTYLGSVDRETIRHLVVDAHANTFAIFAAAIHDYQVDYLNAGLLTIACATLGSFVYLGFFKGHPGANEYGKPAA